MLIRDILDATSEPDLNTGCRLWFGRQDKKGYGHLTMCGSSLYAHRVAWEVDNGPIPDGLGVLHKCDTPACINTDHHFLGDNVANTDDYWRKQGCDPTLKLAKLSREHKVGPPKRIYSKQVEKPLRPFSERKKGRHGRNRALTVDQVREIRTSEEVGLTLAARFDITPGTVSKIRNRRLWANLPDI